MYALFATGDRKTVLVVNVVVVVVVPRRDAIGDAYGPRRR